MNHGRKTAISLAVLVLSSVLFASNSLATTTEYEELWQSPPEVLSKAKEACWWLDGYRQPKTSMGYQAAGEKLLEAYQEGTPVVRNHLSQVYVNPYNNTVFIVVKDLDESVKEKFIDIMNPDKGVTIVFKEGVATLEDLERWVEIISSSTDSLKADGVEIKSIAVSESGKIKVGVKNLKENKVSTLLSLLELKVPKGALVLYPMGDIGLTSQEESHRPVIGGIMITAYSDELESWRDSTIGFYVTWDSPKKYGVLIAAHASSSSTTTVYQVYPDKIGDTEIMGGTSDADVTLVEFDSGISGDPEIYSVGITNNVVGDKSYSSVLIGDDVELCGITSGIETCEIDAKGPIEHPYYDWLDEQLTVDYETSGGDSGAPLYQKFYEPNPGIYTSIAYGVIWGHNASSHVAYAGSIDAIEDELGETFNFADTS